jgi:hypothetical protein
MTIKYFKYSKKTLPAIIAGSIEIYAESGQHIEKQLHKYENLKVGIGFIPNFQSNSVYQYRHTDKWGIWDPKSNTAWIQTEGHPDPMRTLRHELGSPFLLANLATARKLKLEGDSHDS